MISTITTTVCIALLSLVAVHSTGTNLTINGGEFSTPGEKISYDIEVNKNSTWKIYQTPAVDPMGYKQDNSNNNELGEKDNHQQSSADGNANTKADGKRRKPRSPKILITVASIFVIWLAISLAAITVVIAREVFIGISIYRNKLYSNVEEGDTTDYVEDPWNCIFCRLKPCRCKYDLDATNDLLDYFDD